ncbi:MAG: hypothetical protein LBJ67_10375 [Planctomycetaceae bacterium]|jgi:hypothetical protein|nr:hypothetical protein [Planctomycetaceae bacterium]
MKDYVTCIYKALFFSMLLMLEMSICYDVNADGIEEDPKIVNLVTLYQTWLNSTENYAHKDQVFTHELELIGESVTFVDYHSNKKYAKSKDLRKDTVSFIETDIDSGSAVISVEGVGKAPLAGAGKGDPKQGYGDGTSGVFVRGNTPEITLEKFDAIGENFVFIIGKENRQSLQGFQFCHKKTYKETIKKGIGEKLFGKKDIADTMKRQIDLIGNIVMWFDPENGEFRGIDIYRKSEDTKDQQQNLMNCLSTEVIHRNLNPAEIEPLKNQLVSQKEIKQYDNLLDLNDAIGEHRITQKTPYSYIRIILVFAGLILIFLAGAAKLLKTKKR